MSNVQVQPQSQLPAATLQAKNEVEFTPFGSDDKIKLSLAVIRNYIATPTKDKELPDDRNCMKFMMLCRSRRLNPFEGDAYMIGFKKGEDIEWSLITSQSAFMKRAELHPEFDGFESGIIIKDGEDRVIEREGDFQWAGDTLLGGWCVVHFKNRKFPVRKKVQLTTYRKNFGVWLTDPAGMICKVAEVHALRDAFPTSLGGMLLREEIIDIPAEVIATRETRRPEFAQGLPAPDLNPVPDTNSRKLEKTTIKPAKTTREPAGAVNTQPAAERPQASQAASEKASPEPPVETGDPGAQPTDEELEATAGLAPQTTGTAPALTPTPPQPTPNTAQSSPSPAQTAARGDFKPKEGEGIPLTAVRRWLHEAGRTEAELMKVLIANKAAKAGQRLAELSEAKHDNVYKARSTLLTQMSQQPNQ